MLQNGCRLHSIPSRLPENLPWNCSSAWSSQHIQQLSQIFFYVIFYNCSVQYGSRMWLFQVKLNKIKNPVSQSQQPSFKCSVTTCGYCVSTGREYIHHLRKLYWMVLFQKLDCFVFNIQASPIWSSFFFLSFYYLLEFLF